MTQPDIRSALLDAVPELTAPPDRLAQVRRRAARQRTVRLTRAVLVGVLALVAVGGSMRLLAVSSPSLPAVGLSSTGPSTWPSGPPSDSPLPSTTPSGSVPDMSPTGSGSPSDGTSLPAGTGPLIAPDFCPRTLMLVGQLGVDEVPYRTGSPQVTQVTLCRYQHEAFDLSVGPATLVSGPRRANPSAVSSALRPILQPAKSNNWNSEGCRFPSPQSDVIVDIAYAIDVNGRAAAYALARITCQNPWPDDPEIPLEQEVDRVLGPPY